MKCSFSTTALSAGQASPVESLPKPLKKKNLLGLTLQELVDEMKVLGVEKYRAKQIWHEIYLQGAQSVDELTNLPARVRAQMKDTYTLSYGEVISNLKSIDGTRKFLVQFNPGQSIETVFIPDCDQTDPIAVARSSDINRGALCISSQVGCSLTCAFCHTGTMDKKKLRGLTPAEILGQIMIASHAVGDFRRKRLEPRKLDTVVLMGMGEPLYNYKNVKKALEVLMDPTGLNFSRRNLTLSTSGVVPAIDKLNEDLGVNLAISLHAANNKLRDELVPINKTFPLEELMPACRRYVSTMPVRKLTFEYILLAGVNDSSADANALVKLIGDLPCLINLIPFNPWPGAKFETPSNNAVHKFRQLIVGHNIPSLGCTIRWPRGRDVMAACGQLAIKQLEGNLDQPSHPDQTPLSRSNPDQIPQPRANLAAPNRVSSHRSSSPSPSAQKQQRAGS